MSEHTQERRRASRISVDIPISIESIGQPELTLHPDLEKIYERVQADATLLGEKLTGTVRDLSTNGAFVAGTPLPLLSRVAFSFELAGHGRVEAIAWSMWRRDEDCEIPQPDGTTLRLPRGFGVLFEAVPLDARLAINALVTAAADASA